MDGEAAAMTRWQRLPPPRVLRGKIKRGAQPSGIDRVKLDRGEVVWVIDALGLEIDLPLRPNELSQILERISPCQGRQFVRERADREGVRELNTDRYQPMRTWAVAGPFSQRTLGIA
jgi:hypothetical protein